MHAQEVVIRVALPGVESKEEIQMEPDLHGCHMRVRGRYRLSVQLKYTVDCIAGHAEFDRDKQQLEIVKPIVAAQA